VAPKLLDAQKLASKLEKLVLAPIREIPPQILFVDKLKHHPAPSFSLPDFWRRLFRAKSCENVSKNDREIVQESRKNFVVTVPMPEITSSLKVAKKRRRKNRWSQLKQQKQGFNVMLNLTNVPVRQARKRSDEKRGSFHWFSIQWTKYFFPVVVLKCCFDLKPCVFDVYRWQTVVFKMFRQKCMTMIQITYECLNFWNVFFVPCHWMYTMVLVFFPVEFCLFESSIDAIYCLLWLSSLKAAKYANIICTSCETIMN